MPTRHLPPGAGGGTCGGTPPPPPPPSAKLPLRVRGGVRGGVPEGVERGARPSQRFGLWRRRQGIRQGGGGGAERHLALGGEVKDHSRRTLPVRL